MSTQTAEAKIVISLKPVPGRTSLVYRTEPTDPDRQAYNPL